MARPVAQTISEETLWADGRYRDDYSDEELAYIAQHHPEDLTGILSDKWGLDIQGPPNSLVEAILEAQRGRPQRPSWTLDTLLSMGSRDLRALCAQQGIPTAGVAKADLIRALVALQEA